MNCFLSKSFGRKMMILKMPCPVSIPFPLQIRFCWLGSVVLVPTFWCFVSPNRKQRLCAKKKKKKPRKQRLRQQNFLVQSTKSREICELILRLACKVGLISAVLNWRVAWMVEFWWGAHVKSHNDLISRARKNYGTILLSALKFLLCF